MSFLVVKNGTERKSYSLTNQWETKPYLKVKDGNNVEGILPLTTDPEEAITVTETYTHTYETSAETPEGLTDTTALTVESTSGTSYLTVTSAVDPCIVEIYRDSSYIKFTSASYGSYHVTVSTNGRTTSYRLDPAYARVYSTSVNNHVTYLSIKGATRLTDYRTWKSSCSTFDSFGALKSSSSSENTTYSYTYTVNKADNMVVRFSSNGETHQTAASYTQDSTIYHYSDENQTLETNSMVYTGISSSGSYGYNSTTTKQSTVFLLSSEIISTSVSRTTGTSYLTCESTYGYSGKTSSSETLTRSYHEMRLVNKVPVTYTTQGRTTTTSLEPGDLIETTALTVADGRRITWRTFYFNDQGVGTGGQTLAGYTSITRTTSTVAGMTGGPGGTGTYQTTESCIIVKGDTISRSQDGGYTATYTSGVMLTYKLIGNWIDPYGGGAVIQSNYMFSAFSANYTAESTSAYYKKTYASLYNQQGEKVTGYSGVQTAEETLTSENAYSTYRAKYYSYESGSFYTSAEQSEGMSNITYLTCESTSGTSYGTETATKDRYVISYDAYSSYQKEVEQYNYGPYTLSSQNSTARTFHITNTSSQSRSYATTTNNMTYFNMSYKEQTMSSSYTSIQTVRNTTTLTNSRTYSRTGTNSGVFQIILTEGKTGTQITSNSSYTTQNECGWNEQSAWSRMLYTSKSYVHGGPGGPGYTYTDWVTRRMVTEIDLASTQILTTGTSYLTCESTSGYSGVSSTSSGTWI